MGSKALKEVSTVLLLQELHARIAQSEARVNELQQILEAKCAKAATRQQPTESVVTMPLGATDWEQPEQNLVRDLFDPTLQLDSAQHAISRAKEVCGLDLLNFLKEKDPDEREWLWRRTVNFVRRLVSEQYV